MTNSEFEIFENLLFEQLKTENKDCFDTINKYKKLIDDWFNSNDVNYIKKFIKDFNNIILEANVKKYKLFEKVLNHKLFTNVFSEFKKSDILIKACAETKRKAVEWLLTLDILYDTQDEYGMTALMYAVKSASLSFAVDKLLKRSKNLNIVDNNGNNVSFHASSCPDNLKKLMKSGINLYQLNNENESLLLYCCRYDKSRAFEIIEKDKHFDPNIRNCVGKTPAMYLVENARFKEVKSFVEKRKIDPNFRNKFGESLVSTYVKKFYQQYTGNIGDTNYGSRYNYVVTKNYALTLISLVELKCDFNVPVDEDGNTAIMVFLMMKDYVTTKYLLDHCKNIDLSIKNKYGINASYLGSFIDEEVFNNLEYNKIRNFNSFSYEALTDALYDHPTFDCKYTDYTTNTKKYKNLYPIVPEIVAMAEQFILEVFFPNAGGVISYGCNTHRNHDNSYGNHIADIRSFY